MASLLDIVPTRITVPVGTTTIEVSDIPFEDLVEILTRFPEVVGLFMGQGRDNPELVGQLLFKAPKAVGAIIAAGIGKLGDEAEEKAARRLSVEAQLDLLVAIYKATMPRGPRPFVVRLKALGVLDDSPVKDGLVDVDALRAKAQEKVSRKRSRT